MFKPFLSDPDEREPLEADGDGVEKEFEEDETAQEEVDSGVVCAVCGSSFAEEQGAPSACKTCWPTLNESERSGLTLSSSDTV